MVGFWPLTKNEVSILKNTSPTGFTIIKKSNLVSVDFWSPGETTILVPWFFYYFLLIFQFVNSTIILTHI